MQWFTLEELTGVQDDPSKRQSAALCLARDREGHFPGQTPLREVQGGGPVRSLGAMEQTGNVYLARVLED